MWNPDTTIKGIYKSSSGDEIGYSLQGGEMLFSKAGQHVALDQLNVSEQDELNLIAKAVYARAKNGFDPDGGAKAAAAHVVRDETTGQQRVFVASNANARSRQQRPHAEVNALVLAKNAIEGQRFKVKKTYLALYNPKSDNRFPATPCGHCREDLTDKKFVDDGAALYCLPSYNPDKLPEPLPAIELFDQSAIEHPDITQTQPNHAFKMDMMKLARQQLPIPAETPEAIKDWHGHMQRGIEYAKGGGAFHTIAIAPDVTDRIIQLTATGTSGRLLHLEGEFGTLTRINQQLANMIKAACNQHKDSLDQLHKVRACLAIRENGEVYGGTYVDLRTHSAKPQAEVVALANAMNAKDIKEIYLMEMDESYIKRSAAEDPAPKLKMPYPEALDGLMKNSVDSTSRLMPDTMVQGQSHTRCMVHAIALNDGKLTQEQLKQGMVSKPIEQLLLNPFQAPSMCKGVASSASAAKGCC